MGKKKNKKKNKNKGMLAKATGALGGLVAGDPKNGGKPRVLELAELAASMVALLRAEKANSDVDDLEDDVNDGKSSKVDTKLRERIEEIVDERIRESLGGREFRRLVRVAVAAELERREAGDEDELDDEDLEEDEDLEDEDDPAAA